MFVEWLLIVEKTGLVCNERHKGGANIHKAAQNACKAFFGGKKYKSNYTKTEKSPQSSL